MNLTVSTALDGRTPHEARFGEKPDVSHLRVWGCRVHWLIPTEIRGSKIEQRTNVGNFVGYVKNGKGYRIYDKERRRIVEATDVQFFERTFENGRTAAEDLGVTKWNPFRERDDEEAAVIDVEGGKEAGGVDGEDVEVVEDEPDEVENGSDSEEDEVEEVVREHPQRERRAPKGLDDFDRADGRRGVTLMTDGCREQEEGYSLVTWETGGNSNSVRERTPPDDTTTKPTSLLAHATLDHSIELGDDGVEALMTWSGNLDQPSFKQAMAGADKEKWLEAVHAELAMLEAMETWDQLLQELPKGRRAIGLKWVLLIKRDAEGKVIKYKARLVARGDLQSEGVDYNNTYAPTVRMDTIRILLALAAQSGWKLRQFDVSSAYLHGKIDEEIYVRQPEGFVDPNNPTGVRRIRKALYGLKQAGRAWNEVMVKKLKEIGFEQSDSDAGLFVMGTGEEKILLALHVDDGLLAGNGDLDRVIEKLRESFGITDLGGPSLFVGISINQHEKDGTIEIDQRHYAGRVLEKFGMQDCSVAKTPCDTKSKLEPVDPSEMQDGPYREMLGALSWLTNTRPDIQFALSQVARFGNCPGPAHWTAIKRILRYVKGTMSFGIRYSRHTGAIGEPSMEVDSDHGGADEKHRSTTGYVCKVGGGAVCWISRRQKSVAISSTEAEYMAYSEAARQVIWVRAVLKSIGMEQKEATLIRGDNRGAIALTSHASSHGRTKHIAVHYHFIRERVESGKVVLRWIPTDVNSADMFTKGLAGIKHFEFCRMVGLVDVLRTGVCYDTSSGGRGAKSHVGSEQREVVRT